MKKIVFAIIFCVATAASPMVNAALFSNEIAVSLTDKEKDKDKGKKKCCKSEKKEDCKKDKKECTKEEKKKCESEAKADKKGCCSKKKSE
ncbi:hypothetical protein RCC89_09040 [Cytophagaceae bacterium ABcell3]|nr:hypothetical protein RCC89_09040 [Cytophagaceae bacterium ABcell3]